MSLFYSRCVALLLSLVLVATAVGAQSHNNNFWATNGEVKDVIEVGSTVYVAGRFSYVGKPAGGWVPFNYTTSAQEPILPRVWGEVNAAVPDGAGGWYIGGYFSRVADDSCRNLAHIRADGSVDPNWKPGLQMPGIVGLVRLPNAIVVAGVFETNGVASPSTTGLAFLDPVTGALQSQQVFLGEGHFTQLQLVDTVLVAGLSWNKHSIDPDQYLLTIGTRSRTILRTYLNPNDSFLLKPIRSITASRDRIFFTTDEFIAVRYDGSTYRKQFISVTDHGLHDLSDLNLTSERAFDDIIAIGDTLYLCGGGDTVNGRYNPGLLALHAQTLRLLDWQPNVQGHVHRLGRDGNNLVLMGDFTSVNGVSCSNLAIINPSTGAVLPFRPNIGPLNAIYVRQGNRVWLGGSIPVTQGKRRLGIAAFNAETGDLTDWNPLVDSVLAVEQLVKLGQRLYLRGFFNRVAGQQRRGLAAIDLTTGQLTDWNPAANNSVAALHEQGGVIYVGGMFNQVGGQPRRRLAALDPMTGAVMPWNPGANGTVHAITGVGNRIFVSGNFDSLGTQRRQRIGSITTTGQVTSWNPGSTTGARQLLVHQGSLFVAMDDNPGTIGGQVRQGLAQLDTTTGLAMSWNPNIVGYVTQLASRESNLLITGNFRRFDSFQRPSLLLHNLSNGVTTPVNMDLTGPLSGFAVLLRSGRRNIYLGGGFDTASDLYRPGFAVYDFGEATTSLEGTESLVRGYRLGPNPTRHDAELHLTLERATTVLVQVTDLAGRTLHSERLSLSAGESPTVSVPLARFAPGLYVLRVTDAQSGALLRADRLVRQ